MARRYGDQRDRFPAPLHRGMSFADIEIAAGTFTPQDREQAQLREIPVEVPAGARALRVELTTDEDRGVLDLGLLDTHGFRGWSGGARRRFVVMADAATPGYLPGPLEPGVWTVLIGLHRVAPEGAPYTVRVGFEPGPTDARDAPATLPRPRPPRSIEGSEGRRWWPGDLHAHTEHSDGEQSVLEVAHLAAAQGLAFLAVTDHNTVSHYADLPAAAASCGVVLLEGQEVTTDRGHANAIGTPDWVDFRAPVASWRDSAEAGGGVLTVNHPLAGDCAWRLAEPPPGTLVEAWHGLAAFLTDHALDWMHARGGVAIGGSDYHRPSDPVLPGQPTTWLEADEPTRAGFVEALRARRVAVSREPTGPTLVRRDGDLVVVDGDGATLLDPEGRPRPVRGEVEVHADPAPGLHRLVDADDELLAIA
jgi:hypothetical protein